jgi:hypothetical protein
MKMILGWALEDRKEEKEELALQLDEIQAQIKLLDTKLNLLGKQLASMDLEATIVPTAQVHQEARPSHS